jgi:hypothetical protein
MADEERISMLQKLDASIAEGEAAVAAAFAKEGNTPGGAPDNTLDETPPKTPAPTGDEDTSEALEQPDGTQDAIPPQDPPEKPEEHEASVFAMDPADKDADPTPPDPEPDKQDPKPYEAQYRTLQGKYDAETKAQLAKIAKLEAQHAAVVGERNQLLAQSSKPLSLEEVQANYGLSDTQIDALGPEAASAMDLMVRSIDAQNAQALTALRQEYEGEVLAQADANFRQKIGEDYPETKGSNALVKFLRSDAERLHNFQTALSSHNARAIGDHVELFRAQAKKPLSKPPLESLEIPTHTSRTPDTTTKQFTREQVQKLNRDYLAQQGRMTDEQRRTAVATIEAAEKILLGR